jgi:peptide-methionine (R)-S-oxide reductase
MTYNTLTEDERRVIEGKATEPAFVGEYDDFYEPGTYICRKCNAPLFTSKSKFDAGCGWPAFDDSFPGALKRVPDPDGMRTEIECAICGGHLGHEFVGEFLTRNNTRECVNSLSIQFIPEGKDLPKQIEK